MSGCDQESYYRDGIFLWRMVIFRAQLEADGDYRPTSEVPDSHEVIIRNAREFLTVDTQDLRIVAHLAGLDYREFYWAMQRRYVDGE